MMHLRGNSPSSFTNFVGREVLLLNWYCLTKNTTALLYHQKPGGIALILLIQNIYRYDMIS